MAKEAPVRLAPEGLGFRLKYNNIERGRKCVTSSERSVFRNKSFRFFFGLAIGATLLYFSIKGVSWTEVKNEFESIAYGWIFVALFFYWIELTMRIIRWRFLLSKLKLPIASNKIFLSFMAGSAANNVLPAKLGEAFRADLLGRLAKVSRMTIFGSIIIERLADIIIILGMTAWGILFISTMHPETVNEVNTGLVLLTFPVALLVIALYFLIVKKPRFLRIKLKAVESKIHNLMQGLQSIEDPRTILALLGSTIIVWTLNCLAIWSIMAALHIDLSVNQIVLLVGMSGISTAIPAAPAGIGTLQYAFHLAAILFDFSTSAALVASALIQIALLGSATLAGAFSYSYAISNHLMPSGQAKI